MRYTGLNPNGINQVASGSVSVLVENIRVATFGTNTLQVTGSTVLSSSLNVIGTSLVTGSTILSSSLNVIGTFLVTGSTILSGSLSVTGPQTLNGNLTTTGSTILSGSLAITGPETLNGNLTVTGSTTLSGSLTNIGNTVITGSLTVVTGSSIELQVTSTGVKIGNTSTDFHTVTGSLAITGPVIYSNFGVTYTTFQASGSTLTAILPTASLYTASIATSQSIAFNAVITGYGTGSRDTITGEIKTTIKRVGGNASLIGTPFRYINADTTGSDINVGVSASIFILSVTGSTTEPYNWFATITTQTV